MQIFLTMRMLLPEICQNPMWKISKAIFIQQARDAVAYQASDHLPLSCPPFPNSVLHSQAIPTLLPEQFSCSPLLNQPLKES